MIRPNPTTTTTTSSTAERSHRYADIGALITLLAERWPKCFSVYERRRRPLKIGIHRDVIAALGDAVTAIELSSALGVYCANASYLRSMVPGTIRIDLDGNPAGAVTEDEAVGARGRLAAYSAKRAKQEPPAAPAKAARLSLDDLKAAALARRGAQP
jgi:ProP effector